MTDVVLRVTDNSYFPELGPANLMRAEALNFHLMLVMSLGSFFVSSDEKYSDHTKMTSFVALNSALMLMSFGIVFSYIIYNEGQTASNSRLKHQAIGEVVLCENNDDLEYIKQFQKLPPTNVLSLCPFVTCFNRAPDQQLITQLQRLNNAPIRIVEYSLQDVTETSMLGLFTAQGISGCMMLSFFTLFAHEKNSLMQSMLMGLAAFPFLFLAFNTGFKVAISHYSHRPENQFSGLFFSRSAANLRPNEVNNEQYSPLRV